MKRIKSVLIAAMLLLCLPLVACSDVKSTKGTVNQGDKKIAPLSSQEIFMGDVMPFYDDGVMNIYHLQDSKGSLYMYYHPIARITTTDYVNYKDEGVALDFEEKIDSPDASLGTGSFIKDKDGKYHSFYTGHNSDLEWQEVIRHAVSTDGQKTWVKNDDFNLHGANNNERVDFRDPYVYYSESDECYYMLVTTRDASGGIIKQYKSDSLDAAADEWEDNGVFFKNDAGSYNMECPSYIELGGYKYLAYSEQGDNRVTHYRYKGADDEVWKKFDRDTIDSTGFYAGRLEKAGDKLYAFAWCARLDGGSVGSFDWGGNLVAHEIRQESDGSLTATMIESVKNTFSNKVTYKNADGGKIEDVTLSGDKLAAYGIEELSDNITRITFTAKVDSLKGEFGITFGIDGAYNHRLGNNVIAFKPEEGRISCYNDVKNVLRYGNELTGIDYPIEAAKERDVEIIIDKEIVTVYYANQIALTTRCVGIQKKNFAFYSNGASVQFKGITFYE